MVLKELFASRVHRRLQEILCGAVGIWFDIVGTVLQKGDNHL